MDPSFEDCFRGQGLAVHVSRGRVRHDNRNVLDLRDDDAGRVVQGSGEEPRYLGEGPER